MSTIVEFIDAIVPWKTLHELENEGIDANDANSACTSLPSLVCSLKNIQGKDNKEVTMSMTLSVMDNFPHNMCLAPPPRSHDDNLFHSIEIFQMI